MKRKIIIKRRITAMILAIGMLVGIYAAVKATIDELFPDTELEQQIYYIEVGEY